MTLNQLGETLLALVEPWGPDPGPQTEVDGRRHVVADSGISIDLNLARPYDPDPDTLYGWFVNEQHQLAGVGNPPEEREVFTFQILYSVDRLGEEGRATHRRDVSDAIDARAHAYAAALADNRSTYRESGEPTPWQHVQTTSILRDTTTFDVRGFSLVATGYRYLQGES